MTKPDDLLIYAHLGDLHMTTEHEQNYADLRAIVGEISRRLDGAIDFVYVPGDNADNGLPDQYALVRRELARLPMPVHLITGDHDMEPGGLQGFYGSLGADRLPKAIDAGGVRCLFLDICGAGSGGPDFRLGADQRDWLASALKTAADEGRRCAIFMHSYPADLRGDGETAAINAAFASREVLLVDMGHTHYNEIANDGRTIFAATRSTGQIEEGPVGYSIVAIDGRTISWRFKRLGDPRPIVLLTAPSDRRMATDASDPDHRPRGDCQVRASVLGGRSIVRVSCVVDEAAPVRMGTIGSNRFALRVALSEGTTRIRVEAEDDLGEIGWETIEIATDPDFSSKRAADGSDADDIGAWVERGLLGTQLGPNRNGRKW